MDVMVHHLTQGPARTWPESPTCTSICDIPDWAAVGMDSADFPSALSAKVQSLRVARCSVRQPGNRPGAARVRTYRRAQDLADEAR